MSEIKNWDGKSEDTRIEYEVITDHEAKADYKIIGELVGTDIYSKASTLRADKTDYLIASSCGILAGLLDVLWVDEFSLKGAQSWGNDRINRFVVKTAQLRGYKKDELSGAIRYLEGKYHIPTDKVTNEYGGGLQHHLRDFSHHVTPVGLISSILNQFTGKGYGTDTEGHLLIVDISKTDLIGKNMTEKIYFGTVNWFFHLISDMAGSSQNAGAGTGIPGPILGLIKEVSTLPFVQDLKIKHRGDDIEFSKWISKLFNGTFLLYSNKDDRIQFDLRTEVGIGYETSRQGLPVLINKCLVRACYFIRRLFLEIKDKSIISIGDLNKLSSQNFLPCNSRSLVRMETISTGVFSTIDLAGASIKSAIGNSSDKIGFAKDILLRTNFVGIAEFVFAVKADGRYIMDDIKVAFQIKAEILMDNKELDIDTSDIRQVKVRDNKDVYESVFASTIEHIDWFKDMTLNSHESMFTSIFDISDTKYEFHKQFIRLSQLDIIYAVGKIIINLLGRHNIKYELWPLDPKYRSLTIKQQEERRPFQFLMIEGNKRIGYLVDYLDLNIQEFDVSEMVSNYDVDGIRVIYLQNDNIDNPDGAFKYRNQLEKERSNPVQHETLEFFFERHFSCEEFSMFMNYAKDFNGNLRQTIGYVTLELYSSKELSRFKESELKMLIELPPDDKLSSDNIYDEQAKILNSNYINRGLYKVMVGSKNFADSFITSEWYFHKYNETGELDQTSIVTGYLKSVEQLLYAIVKLPRNQGKQIRKRGSKETVANTIDNERQIDSTLGALIYFLNNNDDVFDVNWFVKQYIIRTITEWKNTVRNGYFHKENLHDQNTIDEIRQQTIYLYFLILGGCTIDDDDFVQLGLGL